MCLAIEGVAQEEDLQEHTDRREKIATGEGTGDCFATAHVFYIELSLFASGAKHATLVSDSKSG